MGRLTFFLGGGGEEGLVPIKVRYIRSSVPLEVQSH